MPLLHIRSIELYFDRQLVGFSQEFAILKSSYKDIATLPGLQTVKLVVCDKSWNETQPTSQDIDQELFDGVITIASLFKHVRHFSLLPLRRVDDLDLDCFDVTVLRCQETLAQQNQALEI